ncbi:MAG TPA: GNAT family N-acetyltransferase [Fimbriiglobus sp.]|nr:GNAT family N-acetyltransferase [Fimbriiglobus sp.]
MLRPTTPDDTPALLALAEATGVFPPHEVEGFGEVLEDYHDHEKDNYHLASTWEEDGAITGFVYYAPADLTDGGTWDLWWIIVAKARQGRGLGTRLLELVEQSVQQEDGRQLLIETSSLPRYEPTHRFYLKHGYRVIAHIPDYYAEGDDLIVYFKRLTSPVA